MIEKLRFDSVLHKGEYIKYLRQASDGSNKPLVIYLPGAGSRGDDLALLESGGPIGHGIKLDAVIIQPQCHEDNWFTMFEVLLEFIRSQIDKPETDKSRVYLSGTSMGAYAAWQLAISYPEWYAALVPICGGGMYWNAARLAKLPVWAFHGALDDVVLPEESIHMVKAINKAGGSARLTIYPKNDHNAWDDTLNNSEMWEWMFSQKKTI